MSSSERPSPFIKSNPLYDVATKQDFAGEEIQFRPVLDVLELLFSSMAFGNFFINVIDFRDFSYPYNSPSSMHVVGHSPEGKDLKWLTTVLHPDDLPVFLDYGGKAIAHIATLPLEKKKRAMFNHCYRILHGIRKEYIWLYQQHHMSYIDQNGAIVYSISFITDVSHLQHKLEKPTWSVTERLPDGSSRYLLGSEKPDADERSARPLLTPRELEVINLSARGFRNIEIATQLDLGYQTILTFKKKILRKTRSKNMSEAVTFAINSGFL